MANRAIKALRAAVAVLREGEADRPYRPPAPPPTPPRPAPRRRRARAVVDDEATLRRDALAAVDELRRLRLALGLSQRAVAYLFAPPIDPMTVSRWERGNQAPLRGKLPDEIKRVNGELRRQLRRRPAGAESTVVRDQEAVPA